MVISAISAKSCLEVLRFSLDWAVDTLNAFSASLRSAAFTRLLGLAELGTVELGIVELDTAEIGPAELGPAELGPADLGTVELGPLELGTVELGPTELGTVELGTVELCPTDLGALAEAGVAAGAGGGLDCLKIFDICVY